MDVATHHVSGFPQAVFPRQHDSFLQFLQALLYAHPVRSPEVRLSLLQ